MNYQLSNPATKKKDKQPMVFTPGIKEDVQKLYDETTHCLNCGKSLVVAMLEGGDYVKHQGYCSRSCLQAKPPRLVLIEEHYGKPAKKAMLDVLNEHGSAEISAGYLFMSPVQVRTYMKRFGIRKVVRFE